MAPKNYRLNRSKCPCVNCNRDNCGCCINCKGKKQFGGDGRNHQRCVYRICLVQNPNKKPIDPPRQVAPIILPKPTKTTSQHDSDTSSPDKIASSQKIKEWSNTSSSKKGKRSNNSNIPKRQKCNKCPGCLQKEDCKKCSSCLGKRKYGGTGRSHSKCVERLCHVLYPIETARGRSRDRRKRSRSVDGEDEDDTRSLSYEPPEKRERTSSRGSTSTTSSVPRRAACGHCPACKRDDCGECDRCKGKVKFGGDGHDKQICFQRRCHEIYPVQKYIDQQQGRSGRSKYGSTYDPRRNNKQESSSTAPHVSASSEYSTNHAPTTMDLSGESDMIIFAPPKKLSTYIEEAQDLKKKVLKVPPVDTSKIYGREFPEEPIHDVCAGCLGARDDELEDKPVLLCDGPDCGREYHLACCVPHISEVPETDHWLCQDCCPEGSTATLKLYLESFDTDKIQFFREKGITKTRSPERSWFRRELMCEDRVRVFVDGKKVNKIAPHRFPQSELERSAMTQSLALCDTTQLTRTRGSGNEKREPLLPEFYLGKLIRIYIPPENSYHTGRIVDYRPTLDAETGDTLTVDITQFLIRFAAGKDYRKTSYYHWIVLEEHALEVGTTLVWAQIPVGKWTPAMLWLRTGRELVPVQNQLKETDGEIIFDAASDTDSDSKNNTSPSKTKYKVTALARTFGEGNSALINVRDQCVGIDSNQVKAKHLNERTTLLYQAAKLEQAEQERVKKWHAMKQENPFGYYAISSKDPYSLPALRPKDKTGESIAYMDDTRESALCPNIPRGLDRSKILSLLQLRGLKPTKDLAANISCEIIPFNRQIMVVEEKAGLEIN